jgi:hypothetical protein
MNLLEKLNEICEDLKGKKEPYIILAKEAPEFYNIWK